MKKQSLVLIGAMLISLTACQKENITEEVVTPEAVLEQDTTNLQAKVSGEFCRFTLQFNFRSVLHPITGKQICQFAPGNICAIVECFPNPDIIFELPPIIWDPCQLVPCGIDFIDPWVIYERIDPLKFRSFKDKYELRLDYETEAIPFALNENLLGVQFYVEPQPNLEEYQVNYGDPSLQSNVFYLENNIALDWDVAKKLGLKGNMIKAGKYPIVFNKKNRTYNVIFSLEKDFNRG